MGKVLTYMMIAALMLFMPEFLQILTNAMGNGAVENSGQLGQMSNDVANSMKSMTDLMGAMSYIIGIAFGLKAALAFKEYSENGGYAYKEKTPVIDLTVQKKKEESKPVSLKKEEPIVLKKEEKKTEPKVVQQDLFKFNLDFDNKLLNNRVSNIEKLINSVLHIPVLKDDIENKILLSSTQEKYVKQIHTAYIAIPKELRDREVKGSTATKLALEQLILVENGLLEMESELLKQQVSDLNIMSRFLKEKFPDSENSIEKKYMVAGR